MALNEVREKYNRVKSIQRAVCLGGRREESGFGDATTMQKSSA